MGDTKEYFLGFSFVISDWSFCLELFIIKWSTFVYYPEELL